MLISLLTLAKLSAATLAFEPKLDGFVRNDQLLICLHFARREESNRRDSRVVVAREDSLSGRIGFPARVIEESTASAKPFGVDGHAVLGSSSLLVIQVHHIWLVFGILGAFTFDFSDVLTQECAFGQLVACSDAPLLVLSPKDLQLCFDAVCHSSPRTICEALTPLVAFVEGEAALLDCVCFEASLVRVSFD